VNATDLRRPERVPRLGPLVLLVASACGTSAPPRDPPSIQEFRADRDSTPVGERAQLVAVFSGTSAEIEGLGAVQSGQAVETGVLSGSTAFTLKVRRAGQEAVAQLTVAVHYRDRIRPLSDSPVGRQAHVAMVLPDGSALLMGGNTSEAINTPDLDSTQRFDVATEELTAGPRLALSARDREFTVPVPLQGGAFLLVGGGINAGVGLGIHPGALVQRFDPTLQRFTRSADLTAVHSGDTAATLLADGRVLMTSGSFPVEAASETYDPATGAWTRGGDMRVARRGHTATLLADGRVLIAGGIACCIVTAQTISETYTASAELYDPSSGKFEITGPLTMRRGSHRATLLHDGRVLISGGIGGADPDSDVTLADSEVFDPIAGTFSALGSFQIARLEHSAVLLNDGRVLVVGGTREDTQFRLAVPQTELFDPSIGQWAAGPRLDPAWLGLTATLLGNGKVLLFGGADGSGFPRANVFLFE